MRALLVALCACNQVYDLNATRPRDAAEVDVLPTTCPVPPTAPRFAHELNQAFVDCQYFSIDATGAVAMATCNNDNVIGPPDGPLLPSGLPTGNAYAPRPTAGGARVYLSHNAGPATTFDAFERSGGAWNPLGLLPFTGRWMSNVAVDVDGNEHVLVETPSELEEWILKDKTWGLRRKITGTDLKTVEAIGPTLSGDGLRLVVRGRDAQQTLTMFYATRARIDDDFGPGQPLAEVPVPDDTGAYMTNDCTRIYINGLQQVLYLRQQ